MADLIAALIAALERLDKAGAMACIAVGLAIAGLAIAWLAGVLQFPALMAGSASTVSAWVGLASGGALIILGVGSLLGTQAQMSAFIAESEQLDPGSADATDSRAEPDSPLQSMATPFWVCGACRAIREGRAQGDRCDDCGSVSDFVSVESDADRSIAMSMLE